MNIKRRDLLKGAIAATAASVIPTVTTQATAATLKKVVVIGGGFGGSTAAKYLRLWGQGQVEVTHIDTKSSYQSPILSNLVLNGQKTLTNITFSLSNAATKNGYRFVQGTASIDRGLQVVRVVKSDGTVVQLPYDKVIVSPGIEFNQLSSVLAINNGYSDKTVPVPHAWKSGDQVLNLKAQIDKLPLKTGTVVVCIPKKPYRCPPGPYERCCVIADILKRVKGGGKLVIFDANVPTIVGDKYSAIQAETHTFTTAFTGQFAGIVEYVSNATLTNVTCSGGQFGVKTVTVTLGDGSVRTQTCNVLNVIPEHRAHSTVNELIPVGKRFVPVNVLSYASITDPKIHVIGDAQDSGQPKAGHIANSEAKVCADAIVREFGILPERLPDEMPVTNSACYSPITSTTASWLTAGYRYDTVSGTMVRDPLTFAEADTPSSDNYKMMLAWSANLFADTFSV